MIAQTHELSFYQQLSFLKLSFPKFAVFYILKFSQTLLDFSQSGVFLQFPICYDFRSYTRPFSTQYRTNCSKNPAVSKLQIETAEFYNVQL